jgi:hypothetical protein
VFKLLSQLGELDATFQPVRGTRVRMAQGTTANHWLWITTPEFYADDDGRDRRDLRPGATGDWWTCAKTTLRGDLALLWRTSPKSDLGYLIRAETDAFPLHKDSFARARGWRFGCEYRILHKFRDRITYKELREDGWLVKEWGVLRGGLQGNVKAIPPHVWSHLLDRLRKREGPALGHALRRARAKLPRLHREQDIEQHLMSKPQKLSRVLPRLRLWHREDDLGRQLVCADTGGRIDLLFSTPGDRTFLVVELKVVRATSATFGQLSSYVGWVAKHLAKGRRVRGLVIAPDTDASFDACLRTNRDMRFLSLAELGYAE